MRRDTVLQVKKKESSKVRREFLKSFGMKGDVEYAYYEGVTADEVMSWVNGVGPGPNVEDLKLDLEDDASSEWNTEVLHILMGRLKRYCQANRNLKKHPREDAYLKDLLVERYKRARRHWKEAQLRLDETPDELVARLEAKGVVKSKEARQNARRKSKYKMRMRVLAAKTENHAERSHAMWKWAADVVNKLGVAGMSSEDSATDGEAKTECIRRGGGRWLRKAAARLTLRRYNCVASEKMVVGDEGEEIYLKWIIAFHIMSTPCPFSICVRDGQVFTAVHTTYFPEFPPRDFHMRPEDHRYDLDDTRRLSWASNEYPQLVCMPTEPIIYGGLLYGAPLLDRLDITPQTVPIVETKGRFHLDDKLQKSWFELQTMFYDVGIKMFGAAPFPPRTEFYPLPDTFGYTRLHKSRRTAVQCALRSRDAFMPLIAMLKLMYHCMAHCGANSPPIELVHWLIRQGIHAEVANLVVEVLRHFADCPQGALVDPQTVQWLPYIHKFCNRPAVHCRPIPVWFYWGLLEDMDVAKWRPPKTDVSMYCPTALQLQEYLYATPANLSPSPPSPPSAASSPPIPEARTRQRQGETMESFFEREHKWTENKAKHETPAESARRMDRLRAASKHSDPGKKGPCVFLWEKENGYDIRKYVSRGQASVIWTSFADSQRRYNSFRNEWDLCSAFDPSAIPDDEMDDEYDDEGYDDAPSADSTTAYPIKLSDLPASSGLTSSYEHLVQDPDYSPPGVSASPAVPFETMLKSFFGFLPPASPPSPPPPGTDLVPVNQVKGILGYSALNITEHLLQSTIPFVSALLAKTPTVHKSLAIHPESISAIDFARLSSSVRRWNLGRALDCRRYLKIQCVTNDETPLWHIVVEHAAIALFCARFFPCHEVDEYAIVRYFADHGISFKTPMLRPVESIVPPRSNIGYNYREDDYKPTHTDYAQYEARRDAFLLTPRGRAAIMAGGIVWRLARDVVDIGDVLAGPTDHAMIWTRTVSSDDYAYVDDTLSDYELDLICGNYKVLIDDKQEADRSWWPKYWTFKDTSLDMHEWVQNAEDWYQKRLEDIRNGTAQLRSARQWRKALYLLKKSTRLTANFEKVSQDVFPEASA
ncbi:hypothetical protein PLEOSDRAFT_1081782 [Pleurotus ostreatus PC15]|uniref:Uncharacterized protein n=1 Tax=Pleurotus ostreatus (strain PC15) TaxID=1137138 RepID=A0A067NQK9_PLEO1|nr:hypothetical protein PLEOSDRAFT_1081782 [Pleurotus ostreatus PC15]